MAYENNSSHSAQKENKKNNKYKSMKIRFSIFKRNENNFYSQRMRPEKEDDFKVKLSLLREGSLCIAFFMISHRKNSV